MPFSDLQIFHPLAVAGLEVRTDTLPRPLTLPHNLTPADKERLVALLLSSLRAGGVYPGNLIRLAWRNRAWLNSAEAPSILCRSDDALWLIVEEPVESAELFRFVDDCDCLTLIDLRYSSEDEHVQWLAVLKNAMLDAMQSWWRRFVQHDEAGEVNFTAVRRWFESPIDALDYCNTIAAGLFDGHSLIYVERQTMAAILADKAQSLSAESVVALVGFALRERWERLRFHQPKPLPDFTPHFDEWQAAGLGWLAGAEFVPLPAIERLQERETLEPFFARWDREREENAALYQFWDELRAALAPPESRPPEPQLRGADAPLRPSENLLAGTCGTAAEIRVEVARHFPELAPDANDAVVQDALTKETDADRRLLLSAWRASLWLDKAAGRSVPPAESLRAENDVARIIEQIWNQLNLRAATDTLSFAAAESWARLRAALADHLTERARLGETTKLITLAGAHLSESLEIFRSLKLRQQEANALKAMGDLQMRVDDLAGARASYEQALPIYREIEARLGEANVLAAIGRLALAEGDEDEADQLLERAIAINRAIGGQFNPALDSFKYGFALVEMGKKEKARPYLLGAAEMFASIGFDDYAETCRAKAEESDEEEV